MPTDAITRVTIVGYVLNFPSDTALLKPFEFVPDFTGAITDPSIDASLSAEAIGATPDDTGYLEATVPATNDPASNPTNFGLRVTDPRYSAPYTVRIPYDTPVDPTDPFGRRIIHLNDLITKYAVAAGSRALQLRTAPLSDSLAALLAAVEPVIYRDEVAGMWPLRATVTSDPTKPVLWSGTVTPPIAPGYAINNVDFARTVPPLS